LDFIITDKNRTGNEIFQKITEFSEWFSDRDYCSSLFQDQDSLSELQVKQCLAETEIRMFHKLLNFIEPYIPLSDNQSIPETPATTLEQQNYTNLEDRYKFFTEQSVTLEEPNSKLSTHYINLFNKTKNLLHLDRYNNEIKYLHLPYLKLLLKDCSIPQLAKHLEVSREDIKNLQHDSIHSNFTANNFEN